MNRKILFLAYAFLMIHAAEGMDEKSSKSFYEGRQPFYVMTDEELARQLDFEWNGEGATYPNSGSPHSYSSQPPGPKKRINLGEELSMVDTKDVYLTSPNHQDRSQKHKEAFNGAQLTLGVNATECNDEDERYFFDLQERFGEPSVRRKLDFGEKNSENKDSSNFELYLSKLSETQDNFGEEYAIQSHQQMNGDNLVEDISREILDGYFSEIDRKSIFSLEKRKGLNNLLCDKLVCCGFEITSEEAEKIIYEYLGRM